MSIFHITDDIRQIAADAIDTMINELGKDCKLVYDDAAPVVCDNCYFDPTTGRSSGRYNGVGPFPFTQGRCPRCHGTGYLPGGGQGGNFDIVRFLIDWQPKPYNYVDPNVRMPMGLVQTKGFVTDMAKVLQAKYIVIDYKNATYSTQKFVRWGEPIGQGNIVQSRYFICFWQRTT